MVEYKDLWIHHPVGKYNDPNSQTFTFLKYFFELKNAENPNHYFVSTDVDKEYEARMHNYMEWIHQNGISHKKGHYPAYFKTKEGFIYPGMLALEKIQANETFAITPSKMLLTTNIAYNSELNKIFISHSKLFSRNYPNIDYILVAYILWQMSLEKDSFWYPMFEMWPNDVDILASWNAGELDELQDKTSKSKILAIKDEYTYWIGELFSVLEQYPKYFPKPTLSIQSLTRIVNILESRTFG